MCKVCTRKWKKSPKGIESRKRGDRSEVGKARYARYRATEHYKQYAKKRYETMDTNKKKARYTVHNALRDGKLVRPDYCSRCKVKNWSDKRSMIEAHHYKGYQPEFWLTVQWLCTNCHKEADAL